MSTASVAVEAPPTHVPCCSAHGVSMTCERYRRTHFVEVRPCCSIDARALTTETPVLPCPGCGGPMGDGDRATYGKCGPCRIRVRR